MPLLLKMGNRGRRPGKWSLEQNPGLASETGKSPKPASPMLKKPCSRPGPAQLDQDKPASSSRSCCSGNMEGPRLEISRLPLRVLLGSPSQAELLLVAELTNWVDWHALRLL
jgi:hypothetical protein